MSCTAFEGVEKILKERVAKIDGKAFKETCIGNCGSLFHLCFGMCCSLYVGITPQEADVLNEVTFDKSKELKEAGFKHDSPVTVYDKKESRYYLGKRRRGFFQLAAIVHTLLRRAKGRYALKLGLFKDFSYTCVFTLPNGGCALQCLAQREGRHQWYYKPINCWKYPLSLDENILSIFDRKVNPCFPCNQETSHEVCALDALKEELAFLGQIVGRDLISEIKDQ